MTLLLLGFSHRTAPVDLLEALAVPADATPKALTSLLQRQHVREAVVLSTCNRVEVYANVTRFHGGMADLRDHLAEWGGIDPAAHFHIGYDRFDRAAAEHLFAVSSGLESMVVGERQIHGQVRAAFGTAVEEGAVGGLLNRVFRQALRVGKRTRSETSIDAGAASIVDLALSAARNSGAPAQPRVLVIGAGKIGGMASTRLAAEARHLDVANRTPEKAERLCDRLEGSVSITAHGLQAVPDRLADADLVVTSTDATRPIVTVEALREAMATRPERPLVIVDLAVPRDVERGAHEVPGVTVIDIAALREVVAQGPTGDAVREARQIVAEEAEAFAAWTRASQLGPTIASLRLRAEEIRSEETARLASKLSTLDPAQRSAVDALTKGIVNTLLHEPTVRLKQQADTVEGDAMVEAINTLFDLPGDDQTQGGLGDLDRDPTGDLDR